MPLTPSSRSNWRASASGSWSPIFFITTGIQFDATALLRSPAALAEIPLFLAALLVVRAIPALLYARLIGTRRAAVAGLMQATTLTFVIVATQLGVATGQLSPTASASLLAAGLLSAAIFPALAVKLAPHPSTLSPGARARMRCLEYSVVLPMCYEPAHRRWWAVSSASSAPRALEARPATPPYAPRQAEA